MGKVVAGMSVIGMALALAGCGSKTTANDSAANPATGNETVLNDELPADANLSAIGNGDEAAFPQNAVDANGTIANTL